MSLSLDLINMCLSDFQSISMDALHTRLAEAAQLLTLVE